MVFVFGFGRFLRHEHDCQRSSLPDSSLCSEFGIKVRETVGAVETFRVREVLGVPPHAEIASAMKTHAGSVNPRGRFAARCKFFIFMN
jgi:hypothetical protein